MCFLENGVIDARITADSIPPNRDGLWASGTPQHALEPTPTLTATRHGTSCHEVFTEVPYEYAEASASR